MNHKVRNAKNGIKLINQAIVVRSEISDLYSKYRSLSNLAKESSEILHGDLKRAVDALYYFGGGWPTENSKGRMEALLDNFTGMYRVLDFIGEGSKVEAHLARMGIKVSIDAEFKIVNRELGANEIAYLRKEFKSTVFNIKDLRDSRDLVSAIVMECQELQGNICRLADTIKDGLHPQAKESLGVEDEEFDRLCDIAKTVSKGTPKAEVSAVNKKVKINNSITAFHAGLKAI